ncbi:MAG TPA: DUF559 domain-containing protein [Verrucomicrobiae bacterium]|nr:DUF559 domain-containing protein [Verrucomicrobiae bacterium]
MKEESFNDLWDAIQRDIEREHEYEYSPNSERRKIVRRYYNEALPKIMALASESLTTWYSVYPFDWKFNKNESSLWASIRSRPVVLYPEFPVLGYFVDFGNPFLKIAIEADSKEFHDKEEDKARDHKLLEVGWKTFRVSYNDNFAPFKGLGEISEMISSGDEDAACEEIKNWMLNTSDGVVEAIEFFYFMAVKKKARLIENFPEYPDLAKETLRKHRLISFPLPSLSLI